MNTFAENGQEKTWKNLKYPHSPWETRLTLLSADSLTFTMENSQVADLKLLILTINLEGAVLGINMYSSGLNAAVHFIKNLDLCQEGRVLTVKVLTNFNDFGL